MSSATDFFTVYHDSPLGPLELAGDDAQLARVLFCQARHKPAPGLAPSPGDLPAAVAQAIQQLDEYFAGTRRHFELPLSPQGTAFQQRIWDLLGDIPYGSTISYHELSQRHGNLKAIRAVGMANGSNPICIIIPCHRVIGSDGKLVGYGGDLWRKAWLLKHELEHAPIPQGRLF
jgi:methylated-DNA-[protein]-cysteine S-methyltransferase